MDFELKPRILRPPNAPDLRQYAKISKQAKAIISNNQKRSRTG